MFRHVGIVVNDIDKMIWYYTKIIGLEIMYDEIERGKFLNHILNSTGLSPRIIKLGKNGFTIVELLFFNGDKLNEKSLFSNGYTHFSLTVENTEKLYQKMIENNLTPINIPMKSDNNNVSVFFGRDPENNIIEFVQLL